LQDHWACCIRSQGDYFEGAHILWHVYPLLGNNFVYTFPPEPTHARMGHPLLRNESVNTPQAVLSLGSVQSGYKEVFSTTEQ
jgi:hypothetical protein